MIKYEFYSAFPSKPQAQGFANELRRDGYRACVRKGDYGINGSKKRLTYGVYVGGFRV